MENKNNNGNGFGNGFILGLLVGIVATLLLTTKKGRELLHELTEKGLHRFSDLEEKLQQTTASVTNAEREYEELDEEEEGEDFIPEEPLPVKLSEELSESEDAHHEHHHEHEHPHHHHHDAHTHEENHKSHGEPRRFFKKRAN